MTEVELLGFVLQQGEVSSSEVAERFGVRIDHAYQVLRRLEQKGLLERTTRQYGAKYRLTERAKQISQRVKDRDGNLAIVVLLGLAFAILLLASIGDNTPEGEGEEKRKSLF